MLTTICILYNIDFICSYSWDIGSYIWWMGSYTWSKTSNTSHNSQHCFNKFVYLMYRFVVTFSIFQTYPVTLYVIFVNVHYSADPRGNIKTPEVSISKSHNFTLLEIGTSLYHHCNSCRQLAKCNIDLTRPITEELGEIIKKFSMYVNILMWISEYVLLFKAELTLLIKYCGALNTNVGLNTFPWCIYILRYFYFFRWTFQKACVLIFR